MLRLELEKSILYNIVECKVLDYLDEIEMKVSNDDIIDKEELIEERVSCD